MKKILSLDQHINHVLNMVGIIKDNSEDIIKYIKQHKIDVKEIIEQKSICKRGEENSLVRAIILSHKDKLLNFFISHIPVKDKVIFDYISILRTANNSGNTMAFDGICCALKLETKEVDQIKKICTYQKS